MANDNKASFFRIGLVVLMGAVAIAGTLVYLGGWKDPSKEILIETYYDKPVAGLAVGSPVNFRGVRIGEVRKINFIGNEYAVNGLESCRIYILMAIEKALIGNLDDDEDADTILLKQMVEKGGLRATVASNGITGMARIECDYNPGETMPAPTSWMPKHPCIPPKASLLDSLSDSATKVMNQINKMDLNAFWSNINASVESISAATMSSRHMLESYQPELERTMQDLQEATSAFREFAEHIKMDPSALIRGSSPEPLPETSR